MTNFRRVTESDWFWVGLAFLSALFAVYLILGVVPWIIFEHVTR
jgi:hypothetical protein